MCALIYAESVANPIRFSPADRSWNNWHYFSIGLFAFSAAFFLTWYWFAANDD
jgi:hypothetical protein